MIEVSDMNGEFELWLQFQQSAKQCDAICPAGQSDE
jgi:hypothetical protein